MMKTSILVLVASFFSLASAFAPFVRPSPRAVESLVVREMGYVPDGMTAAQYKKLQEKEKAIKASKKFGAFGPQSFKSRSLQSFQTDMEQGKVGHLMPVFNAKEKVKAGKIKQEDIPYMQRLGSWDNSDVKNAKKKQWNSIDKKYDSASNEKPVGLQWGFGRRSGGPKP